jgi:hypothetical protein
MKKILLTIACLLTSLAMVQAVHLNWAWDSNVTPSSDINGTSFASDTFLGFGWVIQLVEYDSGYSNLQIGDSGNVMAAGSLGPNTGVPFKSYSSPGTDVDNSGTVYVRIYNATSVGDATHYVNLGVNGGAGYHTMAATGADPEDATFEGMSDTTTDPQARGSWIAIPEPGTIILFGLGALVIAARKKFRK